MVYFMKILLTKEVTLINTLPFGFTYFQWVNMFAKNELIEIQYKVNC